MDLYHTSPTEITAINSHGRFGSHLFFADHVYQMTAGDAVAYRIELSDDDVIDARSLFYHDDAAKLDGLVAEFAARFDVDADEAEEIIAERAQLDGADADASWDVQVFTARAAAILGYRAVKVSDEQGVSWMIDMAGRESDLVRV